jgi:hypothetical protein
MAKQKGSLLITGTHNGLCYYKLNGRYYVRRKSSLSRKRVKSSPAFKRTMEYAGLLGKAAAIASAIYHTLPREIKKRELYRAITGNVMSLLKEGLEVDIIKARLQAQYARPKRPAAPKAKPKNRYHVTVTGALQAAAFPQPAKAAAHSPDQPSRLRSAVLSPPYRKKARFSVC